jgi:hypothetical protein
MRKRATSKENERFFTAVARAIQKAARQARKTARVHGTRIYVWENGKVVGKQP